MTTATFPVKGRLFALLFLAGLGVGIAYLAFGGVRWEIRRHFPSAEIFFAPYNSPDPTFSVFVRGIFPQYVLRSEPVGIRLADHPHPVDLSRLARLRLSQVYLIRCRIADLRSIEAAGLHPYIHFTDCDFTQLPIDQRHLIQSYDPKNPAAANQFSYESPANSILGLDPL